MEEIVGKIVEAKQQVLSTTSGSIQTSSVAGAGGVMYGGGSSGSVSTRHDQKTTWKIFCQDEAAVSFEHFTQVEGQIGDIVAIYRDESYGLLGIYNFTQDFCYVNRLGYGGIGRVFLYKAIPLFILIALILSTFEPPASAFIFLLAPVLWPVLEWMGIRSQNKLVDEMGIKVKEVFAAMEAEVDLSVEKLKERMRAL